MNITIEWLIEKKACSDAVEAWEARGCEPDPIKIIGLAMEMDHFDWANWLIVRVMKYKQYLSYAVFAAEQVIKIFEKKYPDDKRPRNAIEAAKACIKNPSMKNKVTAFSASSNAFVDAYTAYAYTADVYAVAYATAADAASYAAAAASDASAYAAYTAAFYASDATAANARKEMQIRIIDYGISLLKER